jgi:sialate O-acetylesterase
VPTVLYNAMVHPLQWYPVKGVLWYQGESNAGADDAFRYRDLFRAMIADWRAGWGQGDVPFLWVQLAAFQPAAAEPAESSWAVLRESQSAALALPRTAQAVAIDIGDADDIHPRNKQEVGRRLALAARAVAYGERLEFSGPVYRGHETRDGRIVLAFDHAGGGLVARGDAPARLRGFAIAGADRRFVWADAAIENGRVVVWSEKVPSPAAVRYAWADNPAGANLYNAEGLPASPFRTDDW